MKKALLLIAIVIWVSGCDSKTSPSAEESSGGSVVSAPTDYLKNAAAAKKSAVKAIDTVALNNAITLFGGEVGRYPKDLNELVTKNYIKAIPEPPHGMKIDYDPKTGTVKIVSE